MIYPPYANITFTVIYLKDPPVYMIFTIPIPSMVISMQTYICLKELNTQRILIFDISNARISGYFLDTSYIIHPYNYFVTIV